MATVTAADGARIAYELIGDEAFSDVMVLVHGITECCAAWDPVINRLAPGRNVLAIDLRGHGESERRPPYDIFTLASDIDAVVRDVGIDDALLIGHSLGGMVVSAYAAAGYPARGVINVDQPLETSGFKEVLTSVEPVLRGTPQEFRGLIDAMFATFDGPLAASERERLDAVSSPEQDVVVGVWQLVLDTSADDLNAMTAALAERISVPYLSLHGGDVPGYEEWLRARVANLTYEVWPDHGHYPHLVDPDRFVARVEAFDRTLEAQQ